MFIIKNRQPKLFYYKLYGFDKTLHEFLYKFKELSL